MTEQPNKPTEANARKPTTIGGLMLAVLVVAVYLAMYRAPTSSFLFVLALFPIVIWIYVPIFVHSTHWLVTDPASQPFDPDDPDLLEDVSSNIRAVAPDFERLGFAIVAHLRRSKFVSSDTDAFVTLLKNREKGQVARIGTVVRRANGRVNTSVIVSFVTEFTDGTVLATSSSPLAGDTRIGFREGSASFPERVEVSRLYEVHRAALARYCSDGIQRDLSRVNPVDYQREVTARELDKLVQSGLYYLDFERQVNRLTWKVAFLMSWRVLWPAKPIWATLRRWKAAKAARLLRELGLDTR
jgi:hypothetical protein